MYYYRLYGMLLESELCFPEADELTPPVTPDATLTLGMPPEWVVTEYRQGKFSSITEQVMWFRLYDELLVYVEQGSKAIVWKLDPALDEVRMRTYLLSGAITFLLLQRGYLLIHGSALCCKDKAYLISGPSGSGKSTTLACMIDRINHTREGHVITLEDPIEYLHRHNQSVVTQREIGLDTESYVTGLRAALRQAPDVILVGEMRDLDTIRLALTAAETGHLVFGTLHTSSASQTIDRIIDVFPEGQQQQVRVQLSNSLVAVFSQTLLPLLQADGTKSGRVMAQEVMLVIPAIANLIREAKAAQIYSTMQTNSGFGMQTLEMSLRDLYMRKKITLEDALARSSRPEEFKRGLQNS